MAKRKLGRTKGRRTKGYFYRSGRGWYTKKAGKFIPLRDERGEHLKEEKTPESALKASYARWLTDQQKPPEVVSSITVLDICNAYLESAKDKGAAKTYEDRSDTLFDFCFGIPPEFRHQEMTAKLKEAAKKKRVHAGYGRMTISELLPLHIDQWLASHSTWGASGRRTRIQAVKRALNYGVESGLIQTNPIRGYRTPRANARVTYITPEQEEAMYQNCHQAIALAIRICIRTGARFGREFTELTSNHVIDEGHRMQWVFAAEEIKTRRKRIIRITDADVIEAVRERLAKTPDGEPLFRNTKGQPWTRKNLSQRFRFLKKRLTAKGINLDDDACMYSCRHTYAKRILQGYWSGKPTNIESLARLMGNSPQVCREHYLQWSEIDNDPLWEVA